jgi:hypothetical protein
VQLFRKLTESYAVVKTLAYSTVINRADILLKNSTNE